MVGSEQVFDNLTFKHIDASRKQLQFLVINSLNFQPICKILLSNYFIVLGTVLSSHEPVHIIVIFQYLIKR